MNPLIGIEKEVKLILLSIDDDTKSPTKIDLRRFFPKGKINVYKAHGHHSQNFWELECIFNIAKNGAETHSYVRNMTLLTHVIKLESNTELNDFLF